MSVVVNALSKRFTRAGEAAAEAVGFHAREGSITALLGPSGSGKTTVLRMIAGLETPDGGKVEIAGRDVTAIPVQRRGVGFVFQGYALFDHLSVRRNIGFGLELQKTPRKEREARIDELLALIQLEGYSDRLPGQLSGGQRQRVALARALATKPAVLLLDEPFGALDTQVRAELRHWLRTLHQQTHVTTLLVTHDQDEALELAEQVVVMNRGRVEQVGSAHEVYDHPATPFVASFFGSANVLRGRVASGQLDVGALTLRAPAGAPEGAEIQAFVRPHDVRLRRADAPGVPAQERVLAQIVELTRIGGYFRAELRLPSGESFVVQLPKAEIDALRVGPGDQVVLDVGTAKIFVEDYAI